MDAKPAVTFLDLAESKEFREFYSMMRNLAGVVIALVDPSGKHGKSHFTPGMMCPVCQAIQATPAGAWACLADSREHCDQARRERQTLRYHCHAGLVDFVVPVVVRGHHIASIEGGQIQTEPGSRAGFRRLWKRVAGYGVDRAALETAYSQTPTMTPGRLEAVLSLVRLFAEYFCEAGWKIRGEEGQRPEIARTQRYIREHFNEDLTLAQVAAEAHLSPAYFSTVFRRSAGVTFTRFVQAVRIEQACRLLRESDRPITEIAFSTGFNNLTHFNHVFRQYERCAPTRYRGVKSRGRPSAPTTVSGSGRHTGAAEGNPARRSRAAGKGLAIGRIARY